MAIVEKLYEERNNLWEQMKDLNDREISENRSLDSAEKEQWDKDRCARLVETEDPDYFTLKSFRIALEEAREQNRENASAQRIFDQLEVWVVESGIEDLEKLQAKS